MSFSAADHLHMTSALRLARNGLESSHPNPRVGCVVVREGQVVGTGWHDTAGGPHAEIEALREAGTQARGSTVYVNLEPCAHHGRTPPCADALCEAGVSEVVMAVSDPNPAVSGAGREKLEQAGITCRSGLLAAQAEILNQGFLKRMRDKRPWVRVKLAQSMDGRIALRDGTSQWISSPAARADVQRWRARSSAVLTGIGTVLADDPSLNVRLDDVSRQPVRVIVDSKWRTPPGSKTLGLAGEVVVAGLAGARIPGALSEAGPKLLELPANAGRVDLEALLRHLGGLEMNEVQVEAGGTLCGALLEARLVDEILLYQAPCLLGDTAQAPFSLKPLDDMRKRPSLATIEHRMIGPDLRIRLQPQYPEV
jgi:diaminohydroxyphosphoribosylaminopyrimidine deaminase/5-amino-6-(5-phosphoribosylamino)uracil reductase